MKKLYPLLLAGSLVFGVSAIANAQPPKTKVAAIQQQPRTKEDTINGFLSAYSRGDLAFASFFVKDANTNDPSLKELSKQAADSMGHFRLRAENITFSPTPRQHGLVTASYTLVLGDDGMDHEMEEKDQITLQKYPQWGEENWMIVPPKLDDSSVGFTGRLTMEVAYPTEALARISNLRQEMMQLKQLGLAMMMYAQDHGDRFDIQEQQLKKQLLPYVKDVSIFTAPGDSAGSVSYSINPQILGLDLDNMLSPHFLSKLVMFYQGSDQKIRFSHGGNSPICFADGHVEVVTKEQAKDLRWKP